MIDDPSIHDPTMHNSCINYANMLFYIEINRDTKESKKKKYALYFLKLLFSLLKFSDKNNTAKLVVEL